MYLSYYNLKAKPFQMSTDPAFLWLGEKHREALAVLKYAILENKGVLALTGDVGTGKTTLINALLKSLGKDTITATIYDPRLEVLDFFNTVAAAFQIEKTFEGKGKFILQFMDFLIKAHERNQKVLLIIDEAQGINEDLLEEIRLLSNLEAEYTRLLNIFFVGQNEFIDILQKYENRALRQRVTIRYHIDPLTLNETAKYITYRLKVAGTEAPIFDSGAIDEIFFFSGGYPRLINIMCDHALLSGYVREVQVINANLIRECREELLVSKKKSENDFQYSGDDHRSLPREEMYSEPPPDPFIPVEDSHSYSEPPPDPFIPVEDSHSYEDEEMVFSSWQPRGEREEPRKSSKKRFYRSSISIAFLLLVGLAVGYFFYSGDKDVAESFVTLAQQQAKKYLSVKEGSKNDKPSMVSDQTETSDIPSRVEAGKVGDSRFFIVKSPNTSLIKEAVPEETETPQVIPSKKFSEDSDVPTSTAQKTDDPEPGSNNKTMKADAAGTLNVSPESSLETEAPKEIASATTKPIHTEPSDLRQKTPVITPITKETPDKIQTLTQMPSKIEPTLPSTTVAPSDIDKKKPLIIPKQREAPKPFQGHEQPKTPEALKTKTVNPIEKPETGMSGTKPVQEQKKTSERYQAEPEVRKKKVPKSSNSVSSEKQTTTLAAIPSVNPPKETMIPNKSLPGEDKIVSREKAQPPLTVPEENKTVSRVDENVASLSVPTSKSETAGKTGLDTYNLHARLIAFLDQYCRTYEQKDLDKFSTFFAANAVEKGKPFRSYLSKYRQNFNRIDSIEYDIELDRYATQDELGLVKINGIFHVRAKLGGSKEWRKSSGQISMVLEADGNSFKVVELDY